MSDRIIYNCHTGRPSEIVSNVLRSISQITRVDRISYLKISITNNPKNRFRQAYAADYDEMQVVYQSTSIKNVRELEYL